MWRCAVEKCATKLACEHAKKEDTQQISVWRTQVSWGVRVKGSSHMWFSSAFVYVVILQLAAFWLLLLTDQAVILFPFPLSGYIQVSPSFCHGNKVLLSPMPKEYLEEKNCGGKIQKINREHTRAAAQARQKRIVHWVTHRGKETEVTKISRARRTGWTWGE